VTPALDRRPDGLHMSIPPESGYPVCEFVMQGAPQ
jgi:hypothetical protein